MSTFTRSISQIFQGAVKAFQTFPAAIACALAFAVVTMFRIQLDWPEQEAYNFLFNCLHWSFATGALFSLAAITAAQSRFNRRSAFLLANLLGVAAAAVTFLCLYLPGGTAGAAAAVVPDLAAVRASMAMLVSLLAFIIITAYPKDQSDLARSLFMSQKAFFIALIYGLVIMGGASGVAGAIQSLLYHDMSNKVYMYIGTLTGFLAFTIFLGYFPDFRKGQLDKRREVTQKQPRFIEVLFGYIMVPIILALTVVLLLWAGRTVATGSWPVFIQLSGIATAYTIGGIWLHIMVTHHESGLAKFYRRVYPIAALVILVFEAWALINQFNKFGLKTAEYYFILVWILAAAAAILLLIKKAKAHTGIILLACFLAVFSVLPWLGYQALPVANQTARLENLLVSQGMFQGGQIVPAAAEPKRAVRIAITDAVDYLANARDAQLPAWFDQRLGESGVFRSTLGFAQIWPEPGDSDYNGPDSYLGTYLTLPAGAVDIDGYRWVANMQDTQGKGQVSVAIDGAKGRYMIDWQTNAQNGIPSLRIELDGRLLLEEDMRDYLDRIEAAYPPGRNTPPEATLEDMSLELETPEISVLLVFNNIDINVDPNQDIINYWLNLNALYLKEK